MRDHATGCVTTSLRVGNANRYSAGRDLEGFRFVHFTLECRLIDLEGIRSALCPQEAESPVLAASCPDEGKMLVRCKAVEAQTRPLSRTFSSSPRFNSNWNPAKVAVRKSWFSLT